LTSTDKEGVLLFVAPDTTIVRRQAEALYQSVQHTAFAHPASGNPVMHKLFFDKSAIEASRGLNVRYTPRQNQAAIPASGIDAQIDQLWDDAQPPPLDYPFEAGWNGGLLAPTYGTYTLHLDLPGEARLILDGQHVMSGPAPLTRQIVLAQGLHELYLHTTLSAPGKVRLSWQPPGASEIEAIPPGAFYRGMQPGSGLVGQFYPNADRSGEPAIVRIDRQVAYYFHFLPLPRPYSVRWTGRLLAPIQGTYRLGLKAISSASLSIDGRLLIAPTTPASLEIQEIQLAAGMHDIQLEFLDNQSHSQVYLYWQLPDQGLEYIPSSMLLLPEQGAWWPSP
jgi:hypothetical protein